MQKQVKTWMKTRATMGRYVREREVVAARDREEDARRAGDLGVDERRAQRSLGRLARAALDAGGREADAHEDQERERPEGEERLGDSMRAVALRLPVHEFLERLHRFLARRLVVAARLCVAELHVADLVMRVGRDGAPNDATYRPDGSMRNVRSVTSTRTDGACSRTDQTISSRDDAETGVIVAPKKPTHTTASKSGV